MLTMDMATQIYSILKQPDAKFLTQVFILFYDSISSPFMFSLKNVKYLCSLVSYWSTYSMLFLVLNNFWFCSCTCYVFPIYVYVLRMSKLGNRMTSNLCYENFWQLIQGWSFYRAHRSFRKDMVCSQPISQLWMFRVFNAVVNIFFFKIYFYWKSYIFPWKVLAIGYIRFCYWLVWLFLDWWHSNYLNIQIIYLC